MHEVHFDSECSPVPRLKIVRDANLDPQAPVLKRVAVRAVVRRDSNVLLLRSAQGVYNFPGGGVDPGEQLLSALARELQEECGVVDLVVGSHMMTVVELSRAMEEGHVFEMTSRYYSCSTIRGHSIVAQQLEAYEEALGLTPTWITPGEAIRVNESVAASTSAVPSWVERDLHVLHAVAARWS